MKKYYSVVLCVIFVMTMVGSVVLADDTMDRINKTGKIRVGWREGSIPFAFIDPKVGKHVGFSVDMTYLLVDKLSEHFGKKIEIQPFTVTVKTRIPMVANRTVDIEMGSTTHTQKRDEVVDFSLIFFLSETTFLVPKDSDIKVVTDLTGKRVGAARGSTNLAAIRKKVADGVFKPRDILEVETHPQGFLALKGGKIDAYSTDRSLLEGLRMKAPHPENWRTVDFAIAYEPYGYMCREGNSDIRDFINNTIIWSIKTGKFFELYDKWMGPKGVVPIPMSQAYRTYLEMICWPQAEEWWKKK
jgi:ABC-type amino acid transport substrate-binding protein